MTVWTVARQALCPLHFPGNTGVACHLLLQGVFLTQGSNLRLFYCLPWQVGSIPRCHLGGKLSENACGRDREVGNMTDRMRGGHMCRKALFPAFSEATSSKKSS